MNRKEFFASAGCCALALFGAKAGAAELSPDDVNYVPPDKEFVTGWLNDLFAGMDAELDEATKVKVLAYCGRGCVNRYPFKKDLIKRGTGSVETLMEAYKKNFEVWREGDVVHIRYGAKVNQCYCKAGAYHEMRKNDVHCECTRATHQMVFESALGRPIKVEIVESVRRGGQTCHLIAHVG